MWTPSLRYPEPAIEVLDPRFLKYRVMNASIERLATGFRWCEGPVWFGDTRQLIWSDIPNDRLMRWDDASGAVSELRKPAQQANGNTRDRQGRLITCEHLGRRVTRTEYDGRITVIADQFQGKRLNSPNDVVVKSDDSIWFTDPPFGLLGWYEGVHPGVRRHQPTQRPVFFPGRTADVHRRVGHHAPAHPCVRPLGRWPAAAQRSLVHDRRYRGHARRFSMRCGRQPLGRLGHGRGPRRGAGVCAGRYAIGSYPFARALCQRVLWGCPTQPLVHGGQSFVVRAVRQHARRHGLLSGHKPGPRFVCPG